jgi:hypothetical protein
MTRELREVLNRRLAETEPGTAWQARLDREFGGGSLQSATKRLVFFFTF